MESFHYGKKLSQEQHLVHFPQLFLSHPPIGALAQLVASPTDLVKVRLQAQRRKSLESQLGISKQVKI